MKRYARYLALSELGIHIRRGNHLNHGSWPCTFLAIVQARSKYLPLHLIRQAEVISQVTGLEEARRWQRDADAIGLGTIAESDDTEPVLL